MSNFKKKVIIGKFYQCVIGTIFVIIALDFPLKANAEIPPIEIPTVPQVDTTALRNGSLVIQLCNQYMYQASIKPNNLELQTLNLNCQNIKNQYIQCIITSPPENSLQCMENLSGYAENILQYQQYLQ
ncbi:hypothetical protein Sta7437_4469 [Stanieria cyanosphaera PCC 7437]|uniref:Uncharacterized protein n=1 Tax=Stanieria cyanosphaera (strain ATCC 29371 / PCC 7437) TaxID=111780 RepID=K9XZH6_STAC7|nr:hypothetical protein [Stanieria cyanosphaera]AFZ37933.1 hypothetical protein Sta7437_4469 [Stanieria cyanosphaera PCC 7437]